MYRKFIKNLNALYISILSVHKIYLLFFLLLALAYFPMLSYRMSLKNDAITLSYPLFYFFSEQIQQGIMPWWHPNLHMGFPLHAEPGFPFFNPITWIWSVFGSNLYLYTLQVWTYIILSGIGMLLLGRWLNLSRTTQVFMALAYTVSGYYAAHLQHLHYLFEASFVPFCLLFTLKLIYTPRLRNALFLAISLFFLVNSGYPAFVLFTAYFLFILSGLIFLTEPSARTGFKRFTGYFLVAIGFAAALSLPYIASIAEIYPLFNRIRPNSLLYSSETGGLGVKSFISILFPLASATNREFFNTDLTWNNLYTGLFTLAFFIYGLLLSKSRLKIPLFLAGSFMLILSLQGSLKMIFYKFIPFYSFISSNGGSRLYFILMVIIIAGWGLDIFLESAASRKLKNILYWLTGVFILVATGCFFSGLSYGEPSLFAAIKNISIQNALFIQSISGLLFLAVGIYFWKNKKIIVSLGITEMIIAFTINLPFTGLSIRPTSATQKHIDRVVQSQKFNPALFSLGEIGKKDSIDRIIREPTFYSNAVGLMPLASYPSSYKSYSDFIRKGGEKLVGSQKALFSLTGLKASISYTNNLPPQTIAMLTGWQPITTGSSTSSISENELIIDELSITAGRVSARIRSAIDDTAVVAQNYSGRWQYRVNGRTTAPFSVIETLTGIPIKQGVSLIEGDYIPRTVIVCMAISIFAWAGIFIILIAFRKKANL